MSSSKYLQCAEAAAQKRLNKDVMQIYSTSWHDTKEMQYKSTLFDLVYTSVYGTRM